MSAPTQRTRRRPIQLLVGAPMVGDHDGPDGADAELYAVER